MSLDTSNVGDADTGAHSLRIRNMARVKSPPGGITSGAGAGGWAPQSCMSKTSTCRSRTWPTELPCLQIGEFVAIETIYMPIALLRQ